MSKETRKGEPFPVYPVTQWEYKVLRLDTDIYKEEVLLNNFGLAGFELVAVTTETPDTHSMAYFKRPLNGGAE